MILGLDMLNYMSKFHIACPKLQDAMIKRANELQCYPSQKVELACSIRRRVPEWENDIANSPYSACRYALEILKHRWPQMEPALKIRIAGVLKVNPRPNMHSSIPMWAYLAKYLGIHNYPGLRAWLETNSNKDSQTSVEQKPQ